MIIGRKIANKLLKSDENLIKMCVCVGVQYNSTYPDAGYRELHLSGSAWPFGVNLSRILQN